MSAVIKGRPMSMTKPQMRERINWLTKRNELLEAALARKTEEVVNEWESRILSLNYATIHQIQIEAILKYRDLVLLQGKYLDEDDYAGVLNWLVGCLDEGLKEYTLSEGTTDNDV